MDQRFRIRAGGLKTNHHLLQIMNSHHLNNAFPKLSKPMTAIEEIKRSYIPAIGTSVISHMRGLPNVHSRNQGFPIDYPGRLCFNVSHGYAPFSGLNVNQPANW